ncbi:MAG: nitrilase-related carbon-nitrogen hydrolase [Gemmatimonadota bacterium]
MNPISSATLRLVVEQLAPACGPQVDILGSNQRRLEHAARRHAEADLVVFPELALTGYASGDEAQTLALPLDGPLPLALAPDSPAVAFGLIERGRDELVYNAGVVMDDRRILARHRKVYLPTYGIFDEGRTFGRGRGPLRPFELRGWRAGLLVCEDLWHPALPYLLALREVDVLVVLAAAPGRGPSPDPELHPLFGSAARWDLIARSTALLHGVWVVVANRTGNEAGHTFAGGSIVVNPSGDVVARAPQGEEATLEHVLEKSAVRCARSDFSHLRDEDAAYTHRELGRILAEGESA